MFGREVFGETAAVPNTPHKTRDGSVFGFGEPQFDDNCGSPRLTTLRVIQIAKGGTVHGDEVSTEM